ncbi:polysaccharide deacetylase family protein [Roseimaritima ulvae]|uniref:Polysaccharide deacetylase n=1 Tax=Roseimaritima ulvae TaxID=980254 RepID=A0A5B9QMF5_9BACT|nr:polysaccharide deacetylase family protein [Roseimaritima ulvae]QEG38675.1 Polysaccharide deacetylase [Roseimaritima ulvae]
MTTELPRAVMLFSLDLELAWGTRGRPSAAAQGPSLDGARAAIEGLLSQFAMYQVPATWVVVGGLLMGRGDRQAHPWLDEPRFADIPRGCSRSQPRWYADDVLEAIQQCSTPQEIGCHTLTHLYVDPSPAGREPFRQELQRFRELFDQLGWQQPTTFIYPKAMMGHFDVLAEAGFRCFRGPEPRWYENLPGVHASAALRMLDGKLALRPNVGLPQKTAEGLWMLPSSQFYSPLRSVGKYVSVQQRVRKAIKGLRAAARGRRVFHLWTHPFNLGQRSDELLEGLERIFEEACRLRDAGDLDLLSMGNLSRRLDDLPAAVPCPAVPNPPVSGPQTVS